MSVFVTSDCHFGHDRDFIWKARGFDSVEEMNENIVFLWNTVAKERRPHNGLSRGAERHF